MEDGDSDAAHAASSLWNVLQGRGKDGHIYTLVRHSLFGCCVELWHDSVGALHLVVPDSRQGKGMAYTTHCVFSTGITTMEDDCCAPDLLRQLVELSSAPEGRDNHALRVPEGGITAYSSGGELTWTVRQRAASELAGGRMALGGLVVKNAHTEAELLLTRKGAWFLGAPDVLQPLIAESMSRPDFSFGDQGRGDGGPADACRLSSLDIIQGISWAADWRRGCNGVSERWSGATSARGKHSGLVTVSSRRDGVGIDVRSRRGMRGLLSRIHGSKDVRARRNSSGDHFRQHLVSRAGKVGVSVEELHSIMMSAAQNGWNDVWEKKVGEENEGEREVSWRWIGGNDRFINISRKDADGKTALHHACAACHRSTVNILVGRGADVDAEDANGHTPLFYLFLKKDARGAMGRSEACLKTLLDFGASVNRHNKDGVTPLMLASSMAHVNAVRLLLMADADPKARDSNGFTASMMAETRRATSSCLPDVLMFEQTEALLNAPSPSSFLLPAQVDEDEDGDDGMAVGSRSSSTSGHKGHPSAATITTTTTNAAGAAGAAASSAGRKTPSGAREANGDEGSGFNVWEGEASREGEERTVICTMEGRGLQWVSLSVAARAVTQQLFLDRGQADDGERAREGARGGMLSELLPGKTVLYFANRSEGHAEGVIEVGEEGHSGGLCVRMLGSGRVHRYKANRVSKIKAGDEWVEIEAEVPSGCVGLSGDVEGVEALDRAKEQGHSSYKSFAQVFRKQATPTTCGPCSVAIVENVLMGEQASGLVSEGDVMVHVEEIAPLSILQNHGLTLLQVQSLCKARGLRATLFSVDDGHTEETLQRECTRATGRGTSACIIANFYMGSKESNGIGSVFEMGHFSPIAAYDRETDSCLIMDVWIHSPSAYWVPLPTLWRAMCTGKDEAWGEGNVSSLSRGFLLVQGSEPLGAGPSRAPSAVRAFAADIRDGDRAEGSTGLAAGGKVERREKLGGGQEKEGEGEGEAEGGREATVVVARRRARRGETIAKSKADGLAS